MYRLSWSKTQNPFHFLSPENPQPITPSLSPYSLSNHIPYISLCSPASLASSIVRQSSEPRLKLMVRYASLHWCVCGAARMLPHCCSCFVDVALCDYVAGDTSSMLLFSLSSIARCCVTVLPMPSTILMLFMPFAVVVSSFPPLSACQRWVWWGVIVVVTYLKGTNPFSPCFLVLFILAFSFKWLKLIILDYC